MQGNDTKLPRKVYDRISAVYDMIADSGEQAARECVLKPLAVKPGEHVLEIGYGTGHSLLELAKLAGSTAEICGIDISSGMHDASLRRLTQAGLADRVDLRVAPDSAGSVAEWHMRRCNDKFHAADVSTRCYPCSVGRSKTSPSPRRANWSRVHVRHSGRSGRQFPGKDVQTDASTLSSHR